MQPARRSRLAIPNFSDRLMQEGYQRGWGVLTNGGLV